MPGVHTSKGAGSFWCEAVPGESALVQLTQSTVGSAPANSICRELNPLSVGNKEVLAHRLMQWKKLIAGREDMPF